MPPHTKTDRVLVLNSLDPIEISLYDFRFSSWYSQTFFLKKLSWRMLIELHGVIQLLSKYSYDLSEPELIYPGDILLQSLLTKSAQESKANLIFNGISLGHKSYEAKQNVAIVKQHKLNEDVDKLVKGENEESDGTEFTDRVFQSDDDFGDRIEPGSRKDKPEEVVVDDDDMEKKHDKKDDDDEDDDDD
ncbi:hypothetical protein Tco_1135445 [Tanacetum coccineum]